MLGGKERADATGGGDAPPKKRRKKGDTTGGGGDSPLKKGDTTGAQRTRKVGAPTPTPGPPLATTVWRMEYDNNGQVAGGDACSTRHPCTLSTCFVVLAEEELRQGLLLR